MNSIFLVDIVLLSFLFLLASVLVICDFQGIYSFHLAVKNFGIKLPTFPNYLGNVPSYPGNVPNYPFNMYRICIGVSFHIFYLQGGEHLDEIVFSINSVMFKKNVCPFLKAPCLNQWCTKIITIRERAFQVVVKKPTCQFRRHRDVGLISGLRRSPGEGQSNPLQYSCPENPMDRRAWWVPLGPKELERSEAT